MTHYPLEALAIEIDKQWREKGGMNCTEICAIVRSTPLPYYYTRAAAMLETIRDLIGHGYGEGDIEHITSITVARLRAWDKLDRAETKRAIHGVDWSEITDEEFKAEARRRVTRFSPDEFMTDLQSNDRAKLDTLRNAIVTAKLADMGNAALVELASLCDKLDSITGHKPAQAVAVNTTLPGREHELQSNGERE